MLELALEGFLPFCDLQEKPKEEKRSVFRELGLPYVSDPAITRHLAAFLSTTERSPTPFCSTAASSSRTFFATASSMSWSAGTASAPRSSRIAISTWLSP